MALRGERRLLPLNGRDLASLAVGGQQPEDVVLGDAEHGGCFGDHDLVRKDAISGALQLVQ